MALKRVSILGVGLLGGSIGLAVRSRLSSCKVVGYGHRRSTLDKAIEIGAIDEAADSPASAAAGADLVILCTPVSLLNGMLTEIESVLRDGAVVTDVGSTKRSVVDAGERLLGAGRHFVGSHPMAGSEKRGVDYARADLFENATCILTPTNQSDPTALAQVDAFWKALGMQTVELSPADHDRLLADVSHLPHALAAAIITMQPEAALPLAGKGFLDATRIAGGDGALWRDILHDNRDNLLASLDRLGLEIQHLKQLLHPSRAAELEAWLNEAAARRDALLQLKLREVTPD